MDFRESEALGKLARFAAVAFAALVGCMLIAFAAHTPARQFASVCILSAMILPATERIFETGSGWRNVDWYATGLAALGAAILAVTS